MLFLISFLLFYLSVSYYGFGLLGFPQIFIIKYTAVMYLLIAKYLR